jgi:hypothetical protein
MRLLYYWLILTVLFPSNHNSGLAIDVDDYQAWNETLSKAGFRWLGDADVAHFGFVSIDTQGTSKMIFDIISTVFEVFAC